MQIRQGDVFVERVARIPKRLEEIPRESGRVVLAHGEATGHAHAIADPGVKFFRHVATGEQFVRVSREHTRGGAQLRHEEHTAHSLPPGSYRVIRQREYSPAAVRNVAD